VGTGFAFDRAQAVNLAHNVIGEPVSTSPHHAPAGHIARYFSSKYRCKLTD
jgi:hypothetical protein